MYGFSTTILEFPYSLGVPLQFVDSFDFGLKKYKNASREHIRTLRSVAADGVRVGEMLLR
jgi:hypothetical protein